MPLPTHAPAAAAVRAAFAPSALAPFMPLISADLSVTGAFSGYASLFNVPDMGNDVVAPGAFTQSLQLRGARGIRLLFHHDAAQPIGVWTSLREDARGLFAQGQLSLDNSKARDIAALLASGAIDGLSIGFRAAQAGRNGKGSPRRLTQIDLWEISIVTFPMLLGARVTTVKTQPRSRSPTGPVPLASRIQALTAAIRANTR